MQADRKIIVLDKDTVRIVDAVCMMNELLDTGAFLVETINKKRQPYPGMQAIYFLAPSAESAQLLGQDFSGNAPLYREAFLFFTTEMPQDKFDAIARSPAGAYVRAFQELYIDFVAFESRSFHLSLGECLPLFFARESISAYEQTAAKIVSACVSMNLLPTIRYRKSDLDKTSPKLALLVQEQMERFLGRNPDFRRSANASGELLIVDRTIDLMAPLLHEFTYQAMVQDLLDIKEDNRYDYHYTAAGSEAVRTVALDENDSLWVALRHTHIAECSQLIITRFNQFIHDNKAAMKSSSKQQTQSGVSNLGELRDVMGSLGEFQELKAQYSLHLTVAQECMNIFETKQLVDVAGLEQDLATGLDSSGDPAMKGIWNRVLQTLQGNGNLSSADRARLLMLYFLTSPASEAEREGIIGKFSLDAPDLQAIRNLSLLSRDIPRAGIRVAKKKDVEDAPFDVSRYTPEVKRVFKDAIAGTIPTDQFPAVKPGGGGAATASAKAAPVSLRARGEEPAAQPTAQKTADRPVMLFIIGGATYSEVRSAYEASAASKRDCFLGSTHIIRPADFLRDLATLK